MIPASAGAPPDHWEKARERHRRALFGSVALAFGLASFVPPLSVAAIALGAIGLKRPEPGRIRSGIALACGCFFTTLYLVVAVGFVLGPGWAATGIRAGERRAAELCASRNQEAARACGEGYWALTDGAPRIAEERLRRALELDPGHPGTERLLATAESGRVIRPGQGKLLVALVLLLAFVFHEYAHARVAWACGDDTAALAGRLTLNPLVHLDPLGSILLPGLMLLQAGGIAFGWARPVPVNPNRFRHPTRDDILVSFAGAATNLALAGACLFALVSMGVAFQVLAPSVLTFGFLSIGAETLFGGVSAGFTAPLVIGASFLKKCLQINLVLAVFNLLPLPPLDGSHILLNVLPYRWRPAYEKIVPIGPFLLLALMLTGVAGIVLILPDIAVRAVLFAISRLVGLG